VILPQDYIVQKFYQYAGYPKYKKITNTYEAGCPVCREGKSWLKKRRCYYIPDNNIICCHNCGWYSSALNWIIRVSGATLQEITKESQQYDILPVDLLASDDKPCLKQNSNEYKLPQDCINLYDPQQLEYYKNNKVVGDVLEVLAKRRLLTAVNRPKTLWLTLNDRIHKNRIVIPFYDGNGEIVFYQTRAVYDGDLKFKPKYLGKVNGERSIFNIDRVSSDLDYIFIFEGPIDAFFVKNGVAIAGIQEKSYKTFTSLQEQQLNIYKLHQRIWVLDSQWIDKASYQKTEQLIESGEHVFIWPQSLGVKFKDINDVCISAQKDEIPTEFLLRYSYTGLKAKLMLANINR